MNFLKQCFTPKSIKAEYLGGMACFAHRSLKLPNGKETQTVVDIVKKHRSKPEHWRSQEDYWDYTFDANEYVPFILYDIVQRDELLATLTKSSVKEVCLGAAFRETGWQMANVTSSIKRNWLTRNTKERKDWVVLLNLNPKKEVEGLVVMFCSNGKAKIDTLCKSCEALPGAGKDLMHLALLSAYFAYGCKDFELTAAAIDDVICEKTVTANKLFEYYNTFGFNKIEGKDYDMTMQIDVDENPIEPNALKGGARTSALKKHSVNGKTYVIKTSKNGKKYIERTSNNKTIYRQYLNSYVGNNNL